MEAGLYGGENWLAWAAVFAGTWRRVRWGMKKRSAAESSPVARGRSSPDGSPFRLRPAFPGRGTHRPPGTPLAAGVAHGTRGNVDRATSTAGVGDRMDGRYEFEGAEVRALLTNSNEHGSEIRPVARPGRRRCG